MSQLAVTLFFLVTLAWVRDSGANIFGFHASLQVDGKHICGGIFIGEVYVITAASCVDGVPRRRLRVGLGIADIEAPSPSAEFRDVVKITKHPDYSRPGRPDDVAMLKLDSRVEEGRSIFRAVLSSQDIPQHEHKGQELKVTGWESLVRPGCGRADIVFILDSSGSIEEDEWVLVQDFAADLVKSQIIGPGNIQVGVISYSRNTEVNFHLNEYGDLRSVFFAIYRIDQMRSTTYTHLAIEEMNSDMFTAANGDRENSPNIAIVITDGRSHDTNLTINAADQARKKGITMFAVGVGDYDQTELEGIANKLSNQHVFSANAFEALAAILPDVINSTCKAADGGLTGDLKVSTVELLEEAECRKLLGGYFNADKQVCTPGSVECVADVGGALSREFNIAVGMMTTTKDKCDPDKTATSYTRLSYYREWVRTVTEGM